MPIEENKSEGQAAESIVEKTEKKQDPFARLESLRMEALSGTKTRKEKIVDQASQRIETAVDSVQATPAEVDEIKQEIAPVQAKMEQVVAETEQKIEAAPAAPEKVSSALMPETGESEPASPSTEVPVAEGKTERAGEGSVEKLKSDYRDVLEKIRPLEEKIAELEDQRDELLSERRKAEEAKDAQKLEEITKKLEQNHDEAYKLQWGEGGLEASKYEQRQLILEFKKLNGYDENLTQEAREKLGGGAANTDANRLVLNKYLGLELPIVSRDLKMRTSGKRGEPEIIDDRDSPEGRYNISLLVKARAELFLKAQEAQQEIKDISPEERTKILEEHALEWDAINEESWHSGARDLKEHWKNENISDVFTTFAFGHPESGVQPKTIYGDGYKLDPEAAAAMEKAGFKSPYEMSLRGDYVSMSMTRILFVQKIAKEKGLI